MKLNPESCAAEPPVEFASKVRTTQLCKDGCTVATLSKFAASAVKVTTTVGADGKACENTSE